MNTLATVLLVVSILVTVVRCETDYEKVVRCVKEAADDCLNGDHCGQNQSNNGEIAVVKECCSYDPAIKKEDADSKIKCFTDSFNKKIDGTGSCIVRGSYNTELTSLTISVDCTDLKCDNSSGGSPFKKMDWNWCW